MSVVHTVLRALAILGVFRRRGLWELNPIDSAVRVPSCTKCTGAAIANRGRTAQPRSLKIRRTSEAFDRFVRGNVAHSETSPGALLLRQHFETGRPPAGE